MQGIEQAAAALRRQLAPGEIDGQAFADATRQHLGVELPRPTGAASLRIVGVAEQDGQTVDAAQAGIEPQAFQVYARKADAQFGEDAFAFVAGTAHGAKPRPSAEALRWSMRWAPTTSTSAPPSWPACRKSVYGAANDRRGHFSR